MCLKKYILIPINKLRTYRLEIFNQIKSNHEYEESRVLVVSKTRMTNNHVCIGAITDSGKYLRLLYPDNSNMLENIDINIYDNLLIKYQKRKDIKLPHSEDINLFYAKKISITHQPMIDILNKLKVNIWKGNPTVLFDNKLIWSENYWRSTAYISTNNIPNNSVGFWISDRDLYLNQGRYEYVLDNITYSIKYVGMHKPQECIYKGTLIRVSLARWWNNNGAFAEDRCYLQLSEYYPSEDETNILDKIYSSINNRTTISVNYFINGQNIIFNDVIPYKILYLNGNYYLACEVNTPYKFTLFRISKIRAVTKNIQNFNYNSKMLEFINYIQTPFSRYSDNYKDTMIKVKVEIDKSKTSFFEIRKHLPSQKIIERKENGNIIVSFTVTQELEMEELIKKWVPYIKVIEPASLDEKIKNDLKKYLLS